MFDGCAGKAGQQVLVLAGEVLYPNGTVKWWEDNLNDTEFRSVTTLREGCEPCSLLTLERSGVCFNNHRRTTAALHRRQTVTAHEYKEARYWQVCGAEEAPTHELVCGWRVWFPMEGNAAPLSAEVVPAVPPAYAPGAFTSVTTSSERCARGVQYRP